MSQPKTIQAQALELLERSYSLMSETRGQPLGLEEFFPIKLKFIAEEILGWRVEEVDVIELGADVDIHGQSDFGKKEIRIQSRGISRQRANYTLAHEIGHIVLHGKEDIAILNRLYSTKHQVLAPHTADFRREREAEQFAAELLMPRSAVLRVFEEYFGTDTLPVSHAVRRFTIPTAKLKSPDLRAVSEYLASHIPSGRTQSLAEFFGASPVAMATQLRALGIIIGN